MVNVKEIPLFENLAQWEYNGLFYDFHNDYKCTEVHFAKGYLQLKMKKGITEELIFITFHDVVIEDMSIVCPIVSEILTLDNVYRGRFDIKDGLGEFNVNGLGYFYLGFYEDVSFEFFSSSVEVKMVM